MHLSLRWDTQPENLPTQQNGLRLWQGTRDTHKHTHTLTHTHTCTHATHTDNQWCALTYPFVCLFTTIFGVCRLLTVEQYEQGREFGERDHLFIEANECYSEQGFALKYEICHCNAADCRNEIFILPAAADQI